MISRAVAKEGKLSEGFEALLVYLDLLLSQVGWVM